MTEFVTYKKFYEKETCDNFLQVLTANNVAFQLTEDRESLDSLYGDKLYNQQIFVKLQKEDFPKADAILQDEARRALENVDKDHYLYAFTDEELFDILSKPDEWNELDYQLSQRILRDRGKTVTPEIITLLKKHRLNTLAKPEEGQKSWIYAGYMFALLGGLLGIFIGWHLSTFRKTLPNGERVFGYKTSDRAHGTRILIIGIIMLVISIAVRVVSTQYS